MTNVTGSSKDVTTCTHEAEFRMLDTLPCPWCVIDELKRNRDSALQRVDALTLELENTNANLVKAIRASNEPPAARKCVHCNGKGSAPVCCGQPVEDHGEVCCGNPDVDVCETCYGEGTITTIDQYIKTLPADWHKDSSLERWFPLTAQELKLQRDRIIDLERAAQPPGVRPDPNEGPIGPDGLVVVADGVLPPFYNSWKCSQCGKDPEAIKANGPCSCGRGATSTKGANQP